MVIKGEEKERSCENCQFLANKAEVEGKNKSVKIICRENPQSASQWIFHPGWCGKFEEKLVTETVEEGKHSKR